MGQYSYPPAAESARADPMDQYSYPLAPGRSCPAALAFASFCLCLLFGRLLRCRFFTPHA